jgi:hypothetical protein
MRAGKTGPNQTSGRGASTNVRGHAPTPTHTNPTTATPRLTRRPTPATRPDTTPPAATSPPNRLWPAVVDGGLCAPGKPAQIRPPAEVHRPTSVKTPRHRRTQSPPRRPRVGRAGQRQRQAPIPTPHRPHPDRLRPTICRRWPIYTGKTDPNQTPSKGASTNVCDNAPTPTHTTTPHLAHPTPTTATPHLAHPTPTTATPHLAHHGRDKAATPRHNPATATSPLAHCGRPP